MPLSVCVGVTIIGSIFSLAFSFVRLESTEAFSFDSLHHYIWRDSCLPQVLLSDLAAGMVAGWSRRKI